MKKPLVLVLSSMAGATMAQSWFNGDIDGIDGWASQHGGAISDSRVYDDFVISQAIKVQRVYGEFWDGSSGGVCNKSYWEIRQGVEGGYGPPGSGGTLVAGGITSPSTRTDLNFQTEYETMRYDIDLSSQNVILQPGTYWLTVAPDLTGIYGQVFLGTAGTQNRFGGYIDDGLATWDSAFFGIQWQNGLNYFQDGSRGEMSLGLDGVPVPEPANMAVLWIGIVVLIRRRSAAMRQEPQL